MESQNHWGDNAPARQLSLPNETFSSRNRLNLVELLAKGAPWKSPKISGYR